MDYFKTFNEYTFLSKLKDKLVICFNDNISVEIEKILNDNYIDMLIENLHTKRKVLIETKYVKNYNELPLATVSQLFHIKNDFPNDFVLLVSFSNISTFAKSKLDEINVSYLIEPTIDDTVKKIGILLNIKPS